MHVCTTTLLATPQIRYLSGHPQATANVSRKASLSQRHSNRTCDHRVTHTEVAVCENSPQCLMQASLQGPGGN